MQHQTYEFVEAPEGNHPPLTALQRNRKLAQLPGLLVMTTLAGFVVAPQIGLAIYAVGSPDVRATLADHPVLALELAAALAFWAGLICWPLRSLLIALTSRRLVEIRAGEVKVIDESPFSTVAWRSPLETYEGIALNLRSSLSGTRQEVVLVHPNPNRNIVLRTESQIGSGEIRELCRILGLPRVSARRHYAFGGPADGHNSGGRRRLWLLGHPASF